MIRVLSLVAAALVPVQAAALSCIVPDPLQSFRMAHEAPEAYVVLHGRLSFDPSGMPDGTDIPQPGAAETALDPVAGRFEGMALTQDGFTRPVIAPILLQPLCIGQFCASIAPGEGWLLFAQPDGAGGYSVEVDPCGSWTFDRTTEAQRDALAGCIRGEACGG